MLLTKIRNGQLYRSQEVSHQEIKVLVRVVEILYHQGYLRGYYIKSGKIFILLKYKEDKPIIKKIKRISKPSKSIFYSAHDLEKSEHQGILILSTCKGIMSDKSALSLGLGGEVLANVV